MAAWTRSGEADDREDQRHGDEAQALPGSLLADRLGLLPAGEHDDAGGRCTSPRRRATGTGRCRARWRRGKSESASQKASAVPAASRTQVRSRRQPVPARMPTMTARSTRSASGLTRGGDGQRRGRRGVQDGLDTIAAQTAATARAAITPSAHWVPAGRRAPAPAAGTGRPRAPGAGRAGSRRRRARGTGSPPRRPQDGGEVEVAEPPGQHAGADQQPRQPLAARLVSALAMISAEEASSTTSWAKRDVSGPASRSGATTTRSS